jgi:type III pantothenate kinase
MMLCLDCGNTRLKWGLHGGNEWRASGALAHAEVNQLAAQLVAQSGSVPHVVIGCNVAGADMADQIERALQVPVRWIKAEAAQCGVVNRYERRSLGCVDSCAGDAFGFRIGGACRHRNYC